jgi:hypothetical protein
MAHFSLPGFVYVIPSEPHTGLYSGVYGQSQFSAIVVVDETVVTGLGFGDVGLSNIKMSSGSSAEGGRNRFGLLLELLPSCRRLPAEFCRDGRANPSPSPSRGCVCPAGRKLLAALSICGTSIPGLLERNKSRFQEIFSLKLKSELLNGRGSLPA